MFHPASNTIGHNSTRSLGYSLFGNLFLKTPGSANSLHFQSGGIDQIEVFDKELRLKDSNRLPYADGALTRVGTTIMARVNGIIKDLANIPGETSAMGTFDPDPPDGTFWIPVKTYTVGEINTQFLIDSFGEVHGSIGILKPQTVNPNEHTAVLFCFKQFTEWVIIECSPPIEHTPSSLGGHSAFLPYIDKIIPELRHLPRPTDMFVDDTYYYMLWEGKKICEWRSKHGSSRF